MRPVTVDAGGPDDVFPGAFVVWLHVPKGGYGYVLPIDAQVESAPLRPGTRVKIRVRRKDGGEVVRIVDATNLRWR